MQIIEVVRGKGSNRITIITIITIITMVTMVTVTIAGKWGVVEVYAYHCLPPLSTFRSFFYCSCSP